jgi:glutamyl-tRNA reductase
MPFLVLGINHNTATVILSTCNRTEIYGIGQPDDAGLQEKVLQWLSDYHQLDAAQLQDVMYSHVDQDGVRHLMRVASGLDSMVLGEPQILGQLKSAYAVAQEAASLGSNLFRWPNRCVPKQPSVKIRCRLLSLL